MSKNWNRQTLPKYMHNRFNVVYHKYVHNLQSIHPQQGSIFRGVALREKLWEKWKDDQFWVQEAGQNFGLWSIFRQYDCKFAIFLITLSIFRIFLKFTDKNSVKNAVVGFRNWPISDFENWKMAKLSATFAISIPKIHIGHYASYSIGHIHHVVKIDIASRNSAPMILHCLCFL